MAYISEASVQSALDPQHFGKKIVIVKRFNTSTASAPAIAHNYVLGGTVRPGFANWVTSTNTNSAAAQATDITSAVTNF